MAAAPKASDLLVKAATSYASAKAGDIVDNLGKRASGNSSSNGDNGDNGDGEEKKGLIGNVAEKIGEGASPVGGAVKGLGSTIKEGVKGLFSKGSGGGKPKFSNVIEDSFVGVPVSVAYNQWTQFQEFSKMTKAVTSVDQTDEVESNWKAKVGWFNRSWQAKVIEQVPDERIKWASEGGKGTTKGVVTFHPIGDNLTAVLLNLEVHHKGFIEQLGRPFKTAPRRVHKDLKLYRRFIVSEGEETGAWRGTIQDGEVIDDGGEENKEPKPEDEIESSLMKSKKEQRDPGTEIKGPDDEDEEEESKDEESDEEGEPTDEEPTDEESEEESEEEPAEDEEPDEESEEEPELDEPEDEAESDEEPDEESDEESDEEEEPEPEVRQRPKRRARA